MSGYDYNFLLTVFYISYIVFEIPSNMACKYIGPGWFLPAISLAFGIFSLCTAFVNNKAEACAVRFLLGVAEAGALPGIAYYLSRSVAQDDLVTSANRFRWYRRSELTFRLALYIVMAPLAGATGGLLASGILKLDSFGSLRRWRMIFAIEGIVTIALSLIAFLTLTDRPESARWLSREEKDLAIARVKSERVATTNVLDGIDAAKTMRGIFSPVTLATAWIFLLDNITAGSLAFFLPTIVRTIYPKSSVVSQQLHTVPPYVVGACFVLLISFTSWKTDKRNIFLVTTAPMMMIGYVMFLATNKATVRYVATFIIASGAFPYGSLCNAHVSANVVSDTARASGISTNVMFGNVGGLISSWAFLPFDAPDYHIGNGLNLATSTTIFISAILLGLYMTASNKRRDQVDMDAELAGRTQAEIEDLDWKHPGFRWKL